jgi:tRNA dimethylallyltransferase
LKFEKSFTLEILDIQSRGKVPIIVGGTCQYIEALIWTNCILENQYLKEEAITEDSIVEALKNNENLGDFELLSKVDPLMAEKLHPNDSRKIQRCLQVIKETKRKFSDNIKSQKVEER